LGFFTVSWEGNKNHSPVTKLPFTIAPPHIQPATMSAMFERLSRLLSTPGTNENQATDDGDGKDAGTDNEDHRTFTPLVFKVATDAESEFTYDYEGEMIKP
jgi:hypothetical protein